MLTNDQIRQHLAAAALRSADDSEEREEILRQYHSQILDGENRYSAAYGGKARNETLALAQSCADSFDGDVVVVQNFPSQVVMRPDGTTYHRLA